MNTHFSDEEITGWIMGDRPPERRRHAAECETCRRQTGELRNALANFRDQARDLSARQQPPVFLLAPRPWYFFGTAWAHAAFAFALLAALISYQTYSAHRGSAREQSALRDAADAALLNQVDAGISRAVPAPMEPLLALVSWNEE